MSYGSVAVDLIWIDDWEAHPDGPTVSLRCPGCRQVGTFDSSPARDLHDGQHFFGSRRCPNPSCRAHVFVVTDNYGEVITTYPPEIIDFDTTDLPPVVVHALEEAITCHAAKCYRASALMVRRTLEELCAEQNVSGRTLEAGLDALRGKVPVADRMIEGLHDLRLLGNDAAHVTSKDFDQVGQPEATLAIDITKQLLRDIYQHDALIKQLDARKKPRAGG